MVSKTTIGTTHVLAVCRDCAWTDDDYKTADQTSRRHAETTGHTVSVERGQCWTYNQKSAARS